MTHIEKLYLALTILPIVAFYLGSMWVRVGHELEEEEVK